MTQPNYMYHMTQAFFFNILFLLARYMQLPSAVPGMLLPFVDKKNKNRNFFWENEKMKMKLSLMLRR